MYEALSVLCGALVAIMLVAYGQLEAGFGVYHSTVLIHISGLILIAALLLVRRERIKRTSIALLYYLGGVVGVGTTVFNVLAYGDISVSSIIALGLLGQTLTSVFVDQYGLFGMEKHPFDPRRILGLLIIMAGILMLLLPLNTKAWVAAILSLLSGLTVVVSRVLNGRLAEQSSVAQSTFFNYVTGLLASILLLLIVREPFSFSPPPAFAYTGGLLGVLTVFLSSAAVAKLPQVNMTLLLFLGQLFTGLLIDSLQTGALSPRMLTGGLLVFAGLACYTLADKKIFPKKA